MTWDPSQELAVVGEMWDIYNFIICYLLLALSIAKGSWFCFVVLSFFLILNMNSSLFILLI